MQSPILSCLLVLIHALSFHALTVPMPKSGGFRVGDVLTSLYGTATSPFSDESQKAFEERFKEIKAADDVISEGKFNIITKVVASQEKKLDALGISASLSVSYMSCSADAHMEMARKSVNSELDVSVIVRAVSDGRNLRMSVSDINLLEMAENHVEKDSPEAFTETYGTYLVIGYEYGGEILFESTKTAKTASDKESIEAGIRLSLEKGGMKAEGGVDVSASKEDIKKSVESHVEISIRPNSAETPLESLMEELEKIANGTSSETGFENKLTLAAQEILSGTLDPINAIVIPLLTVGSVHDVYKADPNSAGSPAFVRQCNEIYQEVKGLQKQLEVVKTQWKKASTPELPLPTDLILEWGDLLDRYEGEIDNLNTAPKLRNKSKEFGGEPSSFTDVTTATTFLDIKAAGMHDQFERAIMDDYRKLFPETEPPTFSPTFSPTDTPKPTYPKFVGVNDKLMTRDEASNYCLNNFDVRYPLATIRSQADLSAVQNACSGGDCWIGLKNPKYKDAWAPFGDRTKIEEAWRKDQIWDETGTNYPQTDFWADGEPNNGGEAVFPGTGTEGCVAFWAGSWKDSPCDRRNRFVCGPRPPDCGCEYMTVSGKEYFTVADGIGDAKGAYCRSDHDDYGRCCCNAGFGCQSGADFCALPASAAAVAGLEQRDDPDQLPALVALHSAHAVTGQVSAQTPRFIGVNDKLMNFDDASKYCAYEYGMPLANIWNAADNEEVRKACSGGDCWIGYFNPSYLLAWAPFGDISKIKDSWKKNGQWLRDTAVGGSPQSDFWADGEPNNGGAIVIGTGTEGCAAMWNGKWKDSPCDRRNRFVCGPRRAETPDGGCGCRHMTVSGKEYFTVAGDIGDAKGAYCRSDHDDYDRCCCNAGFGCQSGADFCALPASAAAVAGLEQQEDPTPPPALIALHSTHAETDDLDGSYCCQARTVDGWNGNWNGVCWGEQTEADCNSNGRKCEWTPDDCRSELNCLLRDVECESDDDCCSGRCKVDDKLCR